jgi:rhodanese-related sulfurtransferase
MFNNNIIINKINFEDMQEAINNNCIIINTIEEKLQNCLIKGTININEEENIINNLIKKQNNIKIIIYGKNSNCDKVYKKYEQLKELGFVNVYMYVGGLFEWLCLQDIYGKDMFPTTNIELDILKYKSVSLFNKYKLLKNNY